MTGSVEVIEGDFFAVLSSVPRCDVCITAPPLVMDEDKVMLSQLYGEAALDARERDCFENPVGGRKGSRVYANHNARDYMLWTAMWAEEVLKVVKPGALMAVVATPATWGGVVIGLDYVDWQVVDTVAWVHKPTPKAGMVLDYDKARDGTDIVSNFQHAWMPVVVVRAPAKMELGGEYTKKMTWKRWKTGGILIGQDVVYTPKINILQDVDHRAALALMEELVRLMCPLEEMKIFNPFARKGAVGVAGMAQGHEVWCVDKDPERCRIIKNRVKELAVGDRLISDLELK
jgi:DNA modification methylase